MCYLCPVLSSYSDILSLVPHNLHHWPSAPRRCQHASLPLHFWSSQLAWLFSLFWLCCLHLVCWHCLISPLSEKLLCILVDLHTFPDSFLVTVVEKQLFISVKFWLVISIYLSRLFSFLQCPLQLFSMLFFHLVSMLTISLYVYSASPAILLVPVKKKLIECYLVSGNIWTWGFHCSRNAQNMVSPPWNISRTFHVSIYFYTIINGSLSHGTLSVYTQTLQLNKSFTDVPQISSCSRDQGQRGWSGILFPGTTASFLANPTKHPV